MQKQLQLSKNGPTGNNYVPVNVIMYIIRIRKSFLLQL